MKGTPSKRKAAWNAVFTLLAALGILTALLGIGVDALPGSYPGLSLPQLLLTAAGLILALVAFALRSAAVRRRIFGNISKHLAPVLAMAVMTLAALELALAAANTLIYFPPDIPEKTLAPISWRTCDQAGCHYVYDAMVAACEHGEISSRHCIVNRQGFHDTQDFVRSDDLDGRMRILALGDSSTFGLAAEIGTSYVETIEANFPQSIVWNTGMPGAGTEQALTLFLMYAPVLQPQITILGFYVNDFKDNTLPMDIQLWVGGKDGRIFLRRQADDSENATTLNKQRRYYYYLHGVEPPASEIERLIGRTRLGSLLLRMIDLARGEARTRWDRGVDMTREYLRDLRAAAAAQDTALLVLLIPSREDLLAPTPRYENALAIMAELGIPWIDPIHALDVDLDYEPEPGTHWNTVGHQKIGAVLSDCLASFQISGDLSDCEQVKMP